MAKLINGQDALISLANGAAIQYLNAGQWQSAELCTAIEFLQDRFEFRVAPKLITIGGMEIEAPETEAPPASGRYYIPNLADIRLYREVYWHNTNYNQANLKYGLIHLTQENAEAHAKALILISGGQLDEVMPTDPEDPLADLDLYLDDEPAPVEEHEDPSTQEKKPRTRKTRTKPVADATPTEPANDAAEFVTPPAVDFKEPQPEDLDSDVAPEQPASAPELSRVDKLLEDIAKAKTVGEVTTIFTRYTIGLSDADYKIVSEAIVNRHKELADSEAEPEAEQPSLAVRIENARTTAELAALLPEIEAVDSTIKVRMYSLYNKQRLALDNSGDGE